MALEELDLSIDTLVRVPPATLSGIFAALPLTSLNLAFNAFSVLPDGILTGLSNLATLNLGGNDVDPLPVIVTLKRVARGEFKAAIPAGAPFAAAVPVTVTGGTLDGTPATVTVAAGERDSADRTVTPADPRSGAVEVTVGALPAIPSGHIGYALQASADLPLTVVPAPATVTIEAETGQVLANGWDLADFTLTRSPVSGSIDVDVEITESDTFLLGGPATVAADVRGWQGDRDHQIGAVAGAERRRNDHRDGAGGADHTVGTPGAATLNVKWIDAALHFVMTEQTVTVEEGERAVVHIVATTSEGVDQPSTDRPIEITLSTERGEAVLGDYTPFADIIEFATSDFTINEDGRWTASKTWGADTIDDDEYEIDETFQLKLERTAALYGNVTIENGIDRATITITDNEPPPPPPAATIRVVADNATSIFMEWYWPEIVTDDEITGNQIEWSLTGGDPWHVATDLEEATICARDTVRVSPRVEVRNNLFLPDLGDERARDQRTIGDQERNDKGGSGMPSHARNPGLDCQRHLWRQRLRKCDTGPLEPDQRKHGGGQPRNHRTEDRRF